MKLSPFGSALCNDFKPDSDVEVFVEFESGTHVGLIVPVVLELKLRSSLTDLMTQCIRGICCSSSRRSLKVEWLTIRGRAKPMGS